MYKLIFSLLLICSYLFSFAQGENNIWTFGYHNGLNFNNSPPALIQTNMESNGGGASVSDNAGNLLFYSNGNNVWDANGNLMPNGTGILGNGSNAPGNVATAPQGVIIAKSLSNSDQYYLIVSDAGAQIVLNNNMGYIRYSIIDMTLNGGLGDVVAGQKNILLDSNVSENKTLVKGAGCYYWLITREYVSSLYKTYKIDASGIHPPTSYPGIIYGSMNGQMKVSPDGTKIVTLKSQLSINAVEIGNFNNSTGVISNVIVTDSIALGRYGTCFSPDNTKLYVNGNGKITQYDLTQYPNSGALAATKYEINTGHVNGTMRNGPNGKIYVGVMAFHPYIGVINNPNSYGTACNYNPTAIPIPTNVLFTNQGTNQHYGIGCGEDALVITGSDTTIGNTTDTIICLSNNMANISAPSGFNNYIWNDGAIGQNKTINQAGTYWVYCVQDCMIQIDTYKISFGNFIVDLGNDTTLCNGVAWLLSVNTNDASYTWQDGSTEASFTVTQSGTYHVAVTKGNCTKHDTIVINIAIPTLHISPDDTILCQNEAILLTANTNITSSFLWSTGSTSNTTLINTEGIYSVTATNHCGTLTDAVTIQQQNCNCTPFVPNAFTPNNDGLNDKLKIRLLCNEQKYILRIFNRFGECIFYSLNKEKEWDGSQNNRPVTAGVYFYYLNIIDAKGVQTAYKGDITLIR